MGGRLEPQPRILLPRSPSSSPPPPPPPPHPKNSLLFALSLSLSVDREKARKIKPAVCTPVKTKKRKDSLLRCPISLLRSSFLLLHFPLSSVQLRLLFLYLLKSSHPLLLPPYSDAGYSIPRTGEKGVVVRVW